MSDFIKTGNSAGTYASPGTPCSACTCESFIWCDKLGNDQLIDGSVGIDNNNWRNPGMGDEYN